MKRRSNLHVFQPMTTSLNLIFSAEIILRYRIRISHRQSSLLTDKFVFSDNDNFDPVYSMQEPLKMGVSERTNSHFVSKSMTEFGGELLASRERSRLAKPSFSRNASGQIEDRKEKESVETLPSNRDEVHILLPEKAPSNNKMSTLSEPEIKYWTIEKALQFQSHSTTAIKELNALKAKSQPFEENAHPCDSPIENDLFKKKFQSPEPFANSTINDRKIKNNNRSAVDTIGKFATIIQTFVTLKPPKRSLFSTLDGLTGDVLKRKTTIFSPLCATSKAIDVILGESRESGLDADDDIVRINSLFGNRIQEVKNSFDYYPNAANARQKMSGVVSDTKTRAATNENSRIKDPHAYPIFETIPVTPNLAVEVESSDDIYGWAKVGHGGLNSLATKRRLKQGFFSGIALMPGQSLEGAAFAERKRKRLEAERAGRR